MGFLKELSGGIRETEHLVKLRKDRLKLRMTDDMVVTSSGFAVLLLVMAVAAVLLALIAVVLILWLAEAFGSAAVAASVVCGAYLVLLAVLLVLRKKLFRNLFTRFYSRYGSYRDLKSEIDSLDNRIEDCGKMSGSTVTRLISHFIDRF